MLCAGYGCCLSAEDECDVCRAQQKSSDFQHLYRSIYTWVYLYFSNHELMLFARIHHFCCGDGFGLLPGVAGPDEG